MKKGCGWKRIKTIIKELAEKYGCSEERVIKKGYIVVPENYLED